MVWVAFRSVRLTSSGRFISGNARMLCSRSSSNNSLTFSREEYSRTWSSWSEGCLSLFLCLDTFCFETCAVIGDAAGGVFSLLRAWLQTAFWMTTSQHCIGFSTMGLLSWQAGTLFLSYYTFLGALLVLI